MIVEGLPLELEERPSVGILARDQDGVQHAVALFFGDPRSGGGAELDPIPRMTVRPVPGLGLGWAR